MINILTLDNKTPGQAIKESLRRAVYTINMKNIAGVQSYVVESHIKNRYPGTDFFKYLPSLEQLGNKKIRI